MNLLNKNIEVNVEIFHVVRSLQNYYKGINYLSFKFLLSITFLNGILFEIGIIYTLYINIV